MKSRLCAGVFLSTVAGVFGCGSSNSGPDARPIRPDGGTGDARPIDAPAAVFGGTVTLLEVSALNPGASGTAFGQGPSFSATMNDVNALGTAILDENPGSTIGCKAWNLNRSQSIASVIGSSEGAFVLSSTAGIPPIPGCGHSSTAGYACPDPSTQQTGGTIAAGQTAGTATLTDPTSTFTAANSDARYVKIIGAATASNNGVFPILSAFGSNTIVYANPAVVPETLPTAAVHVNIAAVGPIPQLADPGVMADDANLSVMHLAGAHIPAFTARTGARGIGNDFVLDIAELNKLNAIPRDGAAMTISCNATDCPAGSASANVLQITTTDTSVAGLSPFAMPTPTAGSVRIQCASLSLSSAGGSVTVPAQAMALLQNAGIKRIRASLSRVELLSGDQPGTVSVLAGHTILGFTTP
jgi:hypothetical protein